jgi:hypothetical protein
MQELAAIKNRPVVAMADGATTTAGAGDAIAAIVNRRIEVKEMHQKKAKRATAAGSHLLASR